MYAGDVEGFVDRRQTPGVLHHTVYRTIQRFEDLGLVDVYWEDPQLLNRPARKGYTLTSEGLEAAVWSIQQLRARPDPPGWIPIPEAQVIGPPSRLPAILSPTDPIDQADRAAWRRADLHGSRRQRARKI